MSPMPLKVNLPMQNLKKHLRIFSSAGEKSADDWSTEETATVKVGDIYTIFQAARLFSSTDDMSELELLGLALVFREDAGFPMNYFVDDNNFEMSFMEGVLSAKAAEAKEQGLAFYCFHLALAAPLSSEASTALSGMHKWGGSGERKQAPQGLPDPLYFFLNALGVKLDDSLAKEPLPIADAVLALFNADLPAGSKISKIEGLYKILEGTGLEQLGPALDAPADKAETAVEAMAEIVGGNGGGASLADLLGDLSGTAEPHPVKPEPFGAQVEEGKLSELLEKMANVPAASAPPPTERSSQGAGSSSIPEGASLSPLLSNLDDDDDDDLDLSKLENALKDLVTSSDTSHAPDTKARPVGKSSQGPQFDDSDSAWKMLKPVPKTELTFPEPAETQLTETRTPRTLPVAAEANPFGEGIDFSSALAAELNAEVKLNLGGSDEEDDEEGDEDDEAGGVLSSVESFSGVAEDAADFTSALAAELNAEVKLNLPGAEPAKAKSNMEPWPSDFAAAFKAEFGTNKQAEETSADALEDLLAPQNASPVETVSALEEEVKPVAPSSSDVEIAVLLASQSNDLPADPVSKVGLASGHLKKDDDILAELVPQAQAAGDVLSALASELSAIPSLQDTSAQDAGLSAEDAPSPFGAPLLPQFGDSVVSSFEMGGESLFADGIAPVAIGESLFPSEAVEPPLTEVVEPPVVEAVAPPVVEAVAPPVVEAVAPPVVEAVAPPAVEAVAPPVVEAVAQPVVEAVAPPVVEAATIPTAASDEDDDDESRPQKKLSLQATLAKLEEQSGRANIRLSEFRRMHETSCSSDAQIVRQKAQSFQRSINDKLNESRKSIIERLRAVAEESGHTLKTIVADGQSKIEGQLPVCIAELETLASEAKTVELATEFKKSADVFKDQCAARFKKLEDESLSVMLKSELSKLEQWKSGPLVTFVESVEQILGRIEQHRIAGLSTLEGCAHSLSEDLRRHREIEFKRLELLNVELANKLEQSYKLTEISLRRRFETALAEQLLPLLADSKNLLGQKARKLQTEVEERLEANSLSAMAGFEPVLNLGKDSIAVISKNLTELRENIEGTERAVLEQSLKDLSEYFESMSGELEKVLAEQNKKESADAASQESKYLAKIDNVEKSCLSKLAEVQAATRVELDKISESTVANWQKRSEEVSAAVAAEMAAELETVRNHRRDSLKKIQERIEKISSTVQAIQAQYQ